MSVVARRKSSGSGVERACAFDALATLAVGDKQDCQVVLRSKTIISPSMVYISQRKKYFWHLIFLKMLLDVHS